MLPKEEEPLHYHTSNIIGVVIEGCGKFRYEHCANEINSLVKAGDVVLIPKDAFHVFECSSNESMKYIGLEFANSEIDYQMHRLFK